MYLHRYIDGSNVYDYQLISIRSLLYLLRRPSDVHRTAPGEPLWEAWKRGLCPLVRGMPALTPKVFSRPLPPSARGAKILHVSPSLVCLLLLLLLPPLRLLACCLLSRLYQDVFVVVGYVSLSESV